MPALLQAAWSRLAMFPFAGDFTAQAQHEVKTAPMTLVSAAHYLESQLQVTLFRLSIGLLRSMLS